MSIAESSLDTRAATTLRESLRGDLLVPASTGYDQARRLYNAMIDKRPALIARCVDVADVIACVRFAAAEGVEIAVRGGGHNGGGLGSVDGGLVVDLSLMHGVRVDPQRRTATVAGGTTLGELDHATHPFGLAVPSGIISTTGVGGLTLGGGLGYLTRRYGLSIDNLLEADVVLADGSLVRASENDHEDLFWALRGGGGNFGVVTSFTFQARPVSAVVGGPMLWPLEQAAKVLAFYDEFLHEAPDELNGFFAMLTVPPGPPFPKELHLQKMCGIVWCYVGSAEDAQAALAPLRAEIPPALDGVAEMPLPALQSAFDALYPPGDQWYWRADFVDSIPAEAIEAHVAQARELPTWKSTMHLYPVDGVAGRVAPDATAWSYRNARYAQVIVGVDADPANADVVRDWTIGYWEALHPYSLGGAYTNFLMDEGDERVRASYGANYRHLASIKAAYDPTNLFHINQNIRPEGETGETGETGDVVVRRDNDGYARTDVLVDSDWLEEHLHDSGVRVVEVDVSPAAYGEGHIPGAVLWNVYQDLKDGDYQLVDKGSIELLIERSGITRDSIVVFYGYAPAMGFWLMKLFGHPEARILNANRTAWQRGGHPWSADVDPPMPTRYPLPAEEDRIRAEQPLVEKVIGDPGHIILDVRTEPEYRGERFWPSGGMEEGGRAGHIPSAVPVPADGLFDADGAFRRAADLRQIYSRIDLADDREVIPYCTIGGRACTTWFVLAYLLGHERTRVYEGSWAEWGRMPATPVERS